MILNIFSCPEIIWSWFIPLDLPVVNLSGAMPQAQHLIMEFASRFDWVCVCFGSFSLCSPFMGEKCDQHHTIKSGQSCLLPQQSDATCSLCPLSDSGSVTAACWELVSCGKGEGKPLPSFSKRESNTDETPKGSCCLRAALEYQEPSFNRREVSATPAWPETLPDLMAFQEHPGAKEKPFIL